MQILAKHQQGFSLFEILISLIVLSIGMMGLGGLHLASVKGSNEAHYRTEASLLIADLADRMRANTSAVDSGDYENTGTVSCENTPTSCEQNACSAAELAAFDLYQSACGINGISGGVRNLLPAGSLAVTRETVQTQIDAFCLGNPRCVRMNITWIESESSQQDSEFTRQRLTQWIIP